MQESKQPEAFDHNTVLLQVATMFEHARLGSKGAPVSPLGAGPRYAGSIDLTLPLDLDGSFTISFRPSSEASDPHRRGQGDRRSATPPTFESQPFDGARFRMVGDDEVETEGTIVNSSPSGTPGRTVVFQFPEGYRPPVATDFDVACEVGFTVVTVNPDG